MPVYCITGTNRGLGLAFVRQLAQQPDNTVIALTRTLTNDLSDLEEIKTSSSSAGGAPIVHILECDISSADSISRLPDSIRQALGGATTPKIDVLINNSAVQPNGPETTLDFDPALMTETFRINVVGSALVVRDLYRAEMLAPAVRVVNVSSALGSMDFTLERPPRRKLAYSVSKTGVNMLTCRQADDLRTKGGLSDALAVSIDPGWVQTRMGGSQAALTSDESAAAILKVVAGLKAEDNGAFYQYNGEKRAW